MKLTIKNFGPIKDIEFEPKPFSIFIGPQAEGKSTINKLLFFFLHVRDEMEAFLTDALNPDNTDDEINVLLQNPLIKKWENIFEIVLFEENTHVVFDYGGNHTLEVKALRPFRFPNFVFSRKMIDKIHDTYSACRSIASERLTNPVLILSATEEIAVATAKKNIHARMRDIFRFDDDLLYIPAGRSSISIFNDYIGKMNTEKTDYLMNSFLDKITYAKPNLTIDMNVLSHSAMRVAPSESQKVLDCYKDILKGRYIYDLINAKEGIVADDKHIVSIKFASSGQQEVLWILHFLMFILHDGTKMKVFIEEPEAHLFPDSQKALMEFISFVHKKTGSEFYLTTHSPYILTATNNLIYAANVGKNHPEEAGKVVPEDTWLLQEDVAGYFVSGGGMEDIFAKDLGMIKAEMIDNISAIIEEDYGKLYEIQHGNDSE